MPQIVFIEKSGNRRSCAYKSGETLLAVARRNAIDLEGACEGAMACSTCHVIVEEGWFNRLPRPHSDEVGMLDLARGVTPNSRLGCQIVLTDELDGLTVKVA